MNFCQLLKPFALTLFFGCFGLTSTDLLLPSKVTFGSVVPAFSSSLTLVEVSTLRVDLEGTTYGFDASPMLLILRCRWVAVLDLMKSKMFWFLLFSASMSVKVTSGSTLVYRLIVGSVASSMKPPLN